MGNPLRTFDALRVGAFLEGDPSRFTWGLTREAMELDFPSH